MKNPETKIQIDFSDEYVDEKVRNTVLMVETALLRSKVNGDVVKNVLEDLRESLPTYFSKINL